MHTRMSASIQSNIMCLRPNHWLMSPLLGEKYLISLKNSKKIVKLVAWKLFLPWDPSLALQNVCVFQKMGKLLKFSVKVRNFYWLVENYEIFWAKQTVGQLTVSTNTAVWFLNSLIYIVKKERDRNGFTLNSEWSIRSKTRSLGEISYYIAHTRAKTLIKISCNFF